MRFVGWDNLDTEVLYNPRMTVEESERNSLSVRSLPRLRAHVWLRTSGSSATSGQQRKWVALSKEAFLASAAAVNQHIAAHRSDVWIQCLPEFHVGGLGLRARAFLSRTRVESFTAISPGWNAALFRRFVAERGGTLTSLVPTQVHDLVCAKLCAPASLRAVLIGGSALSPTLYNQARLLGWNCLPSYGLTECASQVATATLSSLASGSAAQHAFPELEPLSHVALRIESDGRLAIKSPALLTGYALDTDGRIQFHDPKVPDNRGSWFVTEDIARIDQSAERTVLKILGRANRFIKVGGERVDLNRLDQILEQLLEPMQSGCSPNHSVALIAMEDERLGHAVHLVALESDQDATRKLVEGFNAKVFPFERIRKLHFVADIPRTSLGKVRYAELVARISAASPTS